LVLLVFVVVLLLLLPSQECGMLHLGDQIKARHCERQ
jgi:hypothetical protein